MESEKVMTKGDWSPAESTDLPEFGQQLEHNRPWTARFVDSFKRDPNAHATPKGTVGADGRVFDVESAAANTASSPLQRHLKGRHLQMIAIGGSIGTGLVWQCHLVYRGMLMADYRHSSSAAVALLPTAGQHPWSLHSGL